MAGDNAFLAAVVPSNDADSPLLTGFETDTSVGISRNNPLGLSLASDALVIDEQTRGIEVSGDIFVVPLNDLSSPNSLVQSAPLIIPLNGGSQPLAANVDQVTGLVDSSLLTNPILEALKGKVDPLYGDADFDDDVDDDDLVAVLKARNTLVTDPDGRQDLDGDGRITTLDARKLIVHLQSNTDFDAPDLDVVLTKDTAPGGITNSDGITFELGITGTALDSSLVTRLRAGVDDTPVENFVDILGARQADGRFSLSREQLDAIYGAPLADGEHRFRLWAKDQWANQTGIVELAFTLDTVAPPLTLDLDPAFDTGELGDQQTELETVTLVGQTEPSLSVTLDETGNSTTADAAGQFSFTTIALQEGANTFTVRTADVAGNETVFTQVITRVVLNTPPTVDSDKRLTVQEDNVTPLELGAPTDVDNDDLTITVTTIPDVTKGELQLSDGTPVVTGQNLTAEELTQLVFSPVENATGEAGDFSYMVDDGQGGSASQTIALTIAPVNDAPVITVPTVDSVEAGTELTISGIVVSDVDAGEAQLEVTVSAVNGVLSLGQLDGLTFLTGDGLEDDTLIFTGTLAAINGALESLVYRSDATFSGTETISLVVDDQGNSGEGGALSDAATIDVTVNPPDGILLVEGTDFNTNSEFSFTVPAEPAVLNFTYQDLNFDPTDLNAINDAFEVALVDAEGNSVIHTIGGSRDAFLNVTEGLEVVTAAGVSVDGTVVSVNLAGVTPGTEAKLLMRLVNNDSDEATTVRIQDINVVETPGLTPPGGITPSLATLSSDTVVDFEKLSDVSASLVADYSRTSFNEDTDTLFAGVTVRNAGQYGVDGPIVVAVDNLSDPTVRVVNADGVTPEGLPYYLLSEAVLAPETTTSVGTNLEFVNSGGERFTYDLVFLGHLNEAPEIITEPNLEGSIGKPYRYDVDATDPEDDPVTYSLLLAPEGMTIDSETGVIEWDPQEADRGIQSITVQAADGRGGVAEQSFDLVVGDAPPNRPPVFTTGPVVDARVNTAYEYDADATDLDGDELTYALLKKPAGMEIDSVTGKVTWTPTAIQILGEFESLHDVSIEVTDNKGGVAVQNYVVNVLPEEGNHDPVIVSEPVIEAYISTEEASTNFFEPSPYLSFENSPFKDIDFSSFYLEDFEDNLLNTPGVSIVGSNLIPSSRNGLRHIDSVDADDGLINGRNNNQAGEFGEAQWATGIDGIMVNFDQSVLGKLPTHAGLVWTDGFGDITFEAFDKDGNSLGNLFGNHADSSPHGTTTDDRFYGIEHTKGISAIFIKNSIGGIEIDHIQYGISRVQELDDISDYTYDVDAIDPDDDTLTYSLVESPEDMKIDPDTGEISWNHNNSTILVKEFDFDTGELPSADEDTAYVSNQAFNLFPAANILETDAYSVEDGILSQRTLNRIGYAAYQSETDPGFDPTLDLAIEARLRVQNISGDRNTGFSVHDGLNQYNILLEDEGMVHVTPEGESALVPFNVDIGGDYHTYRLQSQGNSSEFDFFVDGEKIYTGTAGAAAASLYNNSFNNWAFGDGSTGRDNDANVDWDYIRFLQVDNSADVTVRVEDGRGGSDEQEFTIQIEAATTEASGEIRGTKFLDLDADGVQDLEERQELINLSSRAFYNSGLGDLYPGDRNAPLATFFPGPNRSTGDPLAIFSEAPDLSNISSLGDWLANPEATIADSEFWTEVQPVPQRWTVNDETAIIYEIDAGEGSIANLIGDFGVDNGIYIWLDGEYLFGAMRGGPAFPEEYSIGPVDLSPGKHYLQVLREDHGGATGYEVSVTGDGRIEPGLEDWTIYIDANDNGQRDANEIFTTTDADGNYAFEGLVPGTYILREENQSGYVQTFPDTFKHIVTVEADKVVEDIDFGNTESRINAEPEFISTPVKTALVNQRFRYDADAQDANGDLLTYDLSLAPEGMAVDPISGIVVWEPTINQIGTHDVILRVQDGNGGVDLQAFQIEVGNNSVPVITSLPFGPTIANTLYQYDVDAEDADGDELTYSLLTTPDGVSIDETSGLLTWTSTDSDVGDNFIRVQVADGEGGIDTQSFTLPVIAAGAANKFPEINNSPRDAIGLGDDYVFQVEATDPDNDPLTYSLTQKPEGMTIDEKTGLIVWPAEQTQLGEYSFTVKVEDGRGAVVEAPYTVNVVQQTVNGTPTITSTPSFVATIGDQYIYEAEATDPDNDPILWSLVSGPVGLTLDETTGRVGWTPTVDQVGFHEVIIEAIDAQGASFQQGFGLNVSSTNAPPLITSAPPTLAFGDTAYTYDLQASDPNGDALTYSLTVAPDGMTIDESTGLIEWTPTSEQLGTQAVTVSVADGRGGVVEQTYSLNVASDVPNQPPQITSRPAFGATAGQDYTYQIEATDPENLTIRYQLLEGPAGMTVDETTGLLTWTPALADVGSYQVKVAAVDPLDLGATQTFTLTVGDGNQQPNLNNRPDTNALVGQTYAFDLNVTDPDGDAVTYTLEDGPEGMTLDNLGRLRWTPTAEDVGIERIRITFRDETGPGRFFEYDLNVLADTTAPQVALEVSADPVDINDSVIVQVNAVDDVAIDEIGLTVDGTAVALDSNGSATLTFDAVGSVELVATALDTSGNAASTDFSLSVIAPSPNAPIVSILTPGTGESITSFVDVIGTVGDLDGDLVSYELTATPFAGGPTTTLATGTSEINEGVLGEFDGTLLRNDSYILELSAVDAGGNTSSTSTVVDVEGDLKIGNYTLSFVDLSIPLTGIPIVVSRTYDTLNANISDDFGHGWSMDLRDTDLTDNVGESGLEDSGIYNAFFDGAAVYVTLPNGEREKFIFQPQGRGLFGLTTYKPRFVAADGDNTSTLTVDDIDLQRTADGRYVTLSQIPYNPASTLISGTSSGNYTLTTKDGIKYTIDGDSGDLEKVTDRNGNTLTYTEGGVFSSTGRSITFERDPQGRITSITDPTGAVITYTYDTNGDLASISDAEDYSTHFTYSEQIPHYLDEIIGSDNETIARSEFDNLGRINKIFDSQDNDFGFTYDTDSSTQIQMDEFGNPTAYRYDLRGNITAITDALGATTKYTYDLRDNLISIEDPLGNITTYTYDSRNNLLSVIEPHSEGDNPDYFTTRYTYNSQNQVTATIDPSGAVTKSIYDSSGNLLEMQDEEGNSLVSFTYGPGGVVLEERDQFGTQTHVYNSSGDEVLWIDEFGDEYELTHDENGRLKTMTDTSGETLVFNYDGRGREVFADYGDGAIVNFEYEDGNEWTSIESSILGNIERSFTDDGQLASWQQSGVEQENYIYDKAGRLIQIRDSEGNITNQYDYDAAGRVERVTDARGATTKYEYDEAGRIVKEIDTYNNETKYEYYPDGRTKSITDALGNKTSFRYTPTTTIVIDSLGRETKFINSAQGLLEETQYSDDTTSETDYLLASSLNDADEYPTAFTDEVGRVRSFTYTDFGQVETATDLGGIPYQYFYDDEELSSVVGPTGDTESFTYNERGLIETITFADNSVQRITYGPDSLPETVTLPSDTVITYEHDAAGREISRTSSTGEQIKFTYDENGLLTKMEDSTGITEYDYNDAGDLTQIRYSNGSSIDYTRDILGRITEIVAKASLTASAYTTQYEYNLVGNLEKVIDPLNGETTYQYDEVNRLSQRTLPNEVKTTYTYDERDRITEIVHTNAVGEVLSSTTYELAPTGEPNKITWEDGSYVELGYDDALRLAEENHFDGAGSLIESFSYEYDDAGNRIQKTDASGELNYLYEPGSKLVSVDGPGADDEAYGYDLEGRVSSINRDGNTLALEYNMDDQLSVVESIGDGLRIEYSHNGMGHRVSSDDGTQERQFLVGPTLVEDLESPYLILDSSENLQAGYVYSGNQPVMQFGADEPVYYLTDAMGSVIGLTDENGDLIASFEYDGFGNILESVGSASNIDTSLGGDFRFHGEWLESETGLYYIRARNYDSQTGRFLSIDPEEPQILIPESSYPYAFANSNPQLYSDPTGRVTLLGVTVSLNIQTILRNSRTVIVNEVKDTAFEKLGEVGQEIVLKVLGGFLPGFNEALSIKDLVPIDAGNEFEDILNKTMCNIPIENIHLGVGMKKTTGKPLNNGFTCHEKDEILKTRNKLPTPSSIGGFGASNPDLLYSSTKPEDLRRGKDPSSYLIADFKRSISGIKTSSDQYETIMGHAKNYGRKIAVYFTLFGKDSEQRELRAKSFKRHRVFLGTFSLFD